MNSQADGGISWTDYTSSPLRYRDVAGNVVWGCVKYSPGCSSCYAESLAQRFGKGGPFTRATQAGLTPFLDERELRTLLTSKKIAGKRVFLADMTDLFGEWVPDEMIAGVFGVAAARPDVMFQILTKRADRMAAWFDWASREFAERQREVASAPSVARAMLSAAVEVVGKHPALDAAWRRFGELDHDPWPLPNLHLGVSVEDQQRADRLDDLMRTPAAVRFVSAEPLIEKLNLRPWLYEPGVAGHCHSIDGDLWHAPGACRGAVDNCDARCCRPRLDWVIVGGESGPGARPFDIRWAELLIRQCAEARVPIWVKQLGSRPESRYCSDCGGTVLDGHGTDRANPIRLRDRKGGDMTEWPEVLRVRQWPRMQEATP